MIRWVGFSFCAVAVLAWGLLSMVAPAKLQRFMEWYTRADKWTRPKPAHPVHHSFSQRIVGFLATVMGVMMLRLVLLRLSRSSPASTTVAQAPPSATAGPRWSVLVGGFVVIAFGAYTALRPSLVLRLTRANFAGRELSKAAAERALRGGRVLGVLTIVAGTYLLFLWYGWTH